MSLSKPEIEAIIAKGQTVIWKGRVIKRKEDIPSATELAGDDPLHRAAAVKDLDEQVKKLQAELAAAKGEVPVEESKEEAPVDEPKEDKKSVPEPPGKDVAPPSGKAGK